MQQDSVPGTDTVRKDAQALVGGMAHEIWNPLTVIKTMIYAMNTELSTDDSRRADFGVINREILRMERSIRQFIDYTWPADPVLAPVRLDQLLVRVIEQLVHKADAQGVQIETRADREVTVLADQLQIELVFVSLGLNALRSMPAGGRLSVVVQEELDRVNLALEAQPADASTARREAVADDETGRSPAKGPPAVGVVVGDTGEGLAPGLLERVFEPFAIEGGDGVGLSLAIVRHIVKRHGGHIEARNRPEGGTTFTVILPLQELASEAP